MSDSHDVSNIAGRVAIVTGGSRGIGFGIAQALLDAGCRVAICSRDHAQITTAASRMKAADGHVLAVQADVGQEKDVIQLFQETVQKFGTVDLLINNAGNFDGGPVETVSLNDWLNVMNACLTGPFLCTREAFRIMKPKGRGRILNIGSISAQRSRMNSVPYTSAKFGVQGLTHASALEGRDHGIVVSCLHPGNVLVERRQNSALSSDEEPMMTTETIVRAAMTMLTMPDDVNFLDAVVLPSRQLYIGRG